MWMILRSQFRAFRKIEKVLRFKAKQKALWTKKRENQEIAFPEHQNIIGIMQVFRYFFKTGPFEFLRPL